MKTIKKNITTYSVDLDKNIYYDLLFIFKKYNLAKTIVANQYSSINSYLKIYNSRKEIRDIWTENGWLNNFNISKRYIRNAIDDTVGNIKSMWSNTKNNVKILVKNNEYLSDEDRHYIYCVLKSNLLFYNVLNNITIKTDKFNNLNFKYLNSLIKRYVRKKLPKKSIYNKFGSIMIDDELYKIKNGNFYLTILSKGRRTEIKLSSNIKINGNIRLKLMPNKQLRISNVIEINIKSNDNQNIIGIDKNYINVFDTSNENSYGENLNLLQNKYTDILDKKNKKRQYYYTLIKNTDNQIKKDRIKKFNLGKKKYNKTKNSLQEEFRKHINKSIKLLINNETPREIAVENLNFSYKSKRKTNKKTQHKLSGWVKGLIQNRVEYISELNNIKISKVNAAFTSQICCDCGHFGVRKNDIFHCPFCDKVEKSGTVAAKNILSRLDDKEITLYTPYKKVYLILKKRLVDTTDSNFRGGLTESTKTCYQERST